MLRGLGGWKGMEIESELKFDAADLEKAKRFISEGCVRSVLFSGPTYQVEILDESEIWIFIQLDDEGVIQDQFCTCADAEKKKTCAHLAAGALIIFRGYKDPLHVRFQHSIWKNIFEILAFQEGYQTGVLKHEGNVYSLARDLRGFQCEVLRKEGIEKLNEWIDHKKPETEETSIKFSNLDGAELERWRRGMPSPELKFELSFWSDLAKWCMVLEDDRGQAAISFDEYSRELPQMIYVKRDELYFEMKIEPNDWPRLIVSLTNYETNLKVFEFRDVVIEGISFDEKTRSFHIRSKPIEIEQGGKRIEWEDWIFVPGIGFFSKHRDALLKKNTLTEEEIGPFLERHPAMLEKYLVGTAISRKPIEASYHLFFDREENLHITLYLFEPGDLNGSLSAFFDPWVYLSGRGFFRITRQLFKGKEKVIIKEMIPSFIEKNRLWLNRQEGFQIHLASLEMKMSYEMEGSSLLLKRDASFFDISNEVVDFGTWVYVKGQGFFSRANASDRKSVIQEEVVRGEDISQFIHENRDELEQIQGFFFADSGLEKTGLYVTLDENERVIVEPKYTFKEWAKEKSPKVFGDFVYIHEKGFVEIPDLLKIPSKYARRYIIQPDELPYFIKHELKRIKPYILHLDNRLIEPAKLRLTLRGVKPAGKEWLMDLVYTSSYGEVPISEVYEGLLRFSLFILSDAGMITLKDRRFHWLMKISKGAFQEGTNFLKLSTLDWIRLSIFEEVKIPEGGAPEEKEIFATLNTLNGIHITEMPSIKGLKSVLRPYQEIGVRWLWFLYTYGLSGFLCDEMGLGKTHQAMALIAAVMANKKKTERSKFLVVCPTSVVYHWEELLQKFLPKAKSHTYHGPFRSAKELKMKGDIILTTYGVLRSDKELFAKMQFEVAIFDEMQVAKNQKSQIHTALKGIDAEMKLALTGTPIENALSELKSLFDIILPGFLPSNQEFKDEYVTPIEKSGDQNRQEALSALIAPFVLRRKKQDVLKDLPDKIEEIAFVDLSDEQQRIYEEVAVNSKSILEEEDKNFYVHVFALLNKLKQICDHPALFLKDKGNYENHESGKWELFVDLLDETLGSGQKLVIFSQYLDMMDIIGSYLTKRGISYAEIRGSTKDRREPVKRFQTDPSCAVFIGSLQAAGVGIDLTAASVVIHYDRWWNPAKENQATDRVHRLGQNRGVSVFKLVTKHTIEEHIHALIERKKNLIQNIVGYDDENELKSLNRDELAKLLKKIYEDIV